MSAASQHDLAAGGAQKKGRGTEGKKQEKAPKTTRRKREQRPAGAQENRENSRRTTRPRRKREVRLARVAALEKDRKRKAQSSAAPPRERERKKERKKGRKKERKKARKQRKHEKRKVGRELDELHTVGTASPRRRKAKKPQKNKKLSQRQRPPITPCLRLIGRVLAGAGSAAPAVAHRLLLSQEDFNDRPTENKENNKKKQHGQVADTEASRDG